MSTQDEKYTRMEDSSQENAGGIRQTEQTSEGNTKYLTEDRFVSTYFISFIALHCQPHGGTMDYYSLLITILLLCLKEQIPLQISYCSLPYSVGANHFI